jgi:hypothetical protein
MNFAHLKWLVIKTERLCQSTSPANNGTGIACVGNDKRTAHNNCNYGRASSMYWVVRKVANLEAVEGRNMAWLRGK